jgi:hypothetical protein
VTREDIYDHLAQVYLGKRKEVDTKKKKQKKFNAWLLINIFITLIIFASASYGLSAFLAQRGSSLKNNIIFSLHRGAIRLPYNFENSMHPVESFSLSIPKIDVAKYNTIQFSIRAKEEGTPGIVKVVIRNKKNETAYYYIKNVNLSWKEFNIPLKEFKEITDWNSVIDVSFVIETWNVSKKKGLVLIDDVSLSS